MADCIVAPSLDIPEKMQVTVPGDKSISHRAAMFAALAQGTSRVTGFPDGADNHSTLHVLQQLGIRWDLQDGTLTLQGEGLHGFSEPDDVLDCGNSGTTLRMMSGLLAGQDFHSVLTGDQSLRSRPMARIIDPLGSMGADISGRRNNQMAPLAIRGTDLCATSYDSPIASAQVKSALVLASLYAKSGSLTYNEPVVSRDHTERMLGAMGLKIKRISETAFQLELPPWPERNTFLQPFDFHIPGDPSSAAFWVALANRTAGAIKDVALNPGRIGFFEVLQAIGLPVQVAIDSEDATTLGEPVGSIHWEKGIASREIHLSRDQVVACIDEYPLLCVIAAVSPGTHVLRNAEELRTKESDRIKAMHQMLRNAGVPLTEHTDGLTIQGGTQLNDFETDSWHDHRIAMAAAILAIAGGVTGTIQGAEAAQVSYPSFFDDIHGGGLAKVQWQ